MSNVIHLHDLADDLRVDTREVAKGLGLQHASVVRLIDRYVAQFERFGLLRFQVEEVKRAGARGTKRAKFAFLNEDQAYLLLTMSRNSERVVQLKADLVSAFGRARRAGIARSLSAWESLQRLQLEDADSKARATIGAHLLLDRKRHLPDLRARRLALESSVIIPLPLPLPR